MSNITNFPSGVSSFGVPVLGGASVPTTTGNYWFVSSVSGSNGNPGTSPSLPVATIAQAQTLATASNGDVIICMPGHAETVTAAAGITITKAGLYIVGLGFGNNRPTITFSTATTATATLTAANTTFDNFIFICTGFDAIVSPIVVSAAANRFLNCYFQTGIASFHCTEAILTTAGANNLVIDNCQFVGDATSGSATAVKLVGGDSIVIRNSLFTGAYTSSIGPINSITTAQTNIAIYNNTLVNLTASATKAVVLLTGSTGIITNNRVGIGSGAAPFTIDAGWWAGNWSAAAVATNGTLV